MRAFLKVVARVVAPAVVAVSVVGIAAVPAIADEDRSCPFEDGIVINGSGESWDIEFVQSNQGLDDAMLGPAPVSIPAGQIRHHPPLL